MQPSLAVCIFILCLLPFCQTRVLNHRPHNTSPIRYGPEIWSRERLLPRRTSNRVNLGAIPVPDDRLPTSPPSNEEAYELSPPANDATFEVYRLKGCNMVHMLRLTDAIAAQTLFNPPQGTIRSEWDDIEVVEEWFWNTYELAVSFYHGHDPDVGGYGIGHVLVALGCSDKTTIDGGQLRVLDVYHGDHDKFDDEDINYTDQEYWVDGRHYRVVPAFMVAILIGLDRVSPYQAAMGLGFATEDLPRLRAFSDLAYLTWLHSSISGTRQPSNIRYFMSVNIINEITQSLISRSLQNVGATLGPWPGTTFDTDTREFKAILGSPNAMGFGYLLAQHKAAIGNKVISKVAVFHGDNWYQLPCLVFFVVDQPGQSQKRDSGVELFGQHVSDTTITLVDRLHLERSHFLRAKL